MLTTGLSPAAAAETTGITGGDQPLSVVQPSLAMTYLVRVSGDRLGEIVPFGGMHEPGGWATADGRLMNISEYPALFAVLGTTYGGDGTTTFALPDLRARIVVGTGAGDGLTGRALGDPWGTETVALTEAQMAEHEHTVPGGGTTHATGGNAAFDILQPSLALSHLISFAPPVAGTVAGQVRVFAGITPPTDHVAAEGQALSVSAYSELYAVVGSTYGGDGVAEFLLPDLRGRTAIQAGQGFGLTPRALGDAFGDEQAVMSLDQLAPHSHMLPLSGDVTGTTGGGQAIGIMQPTLTLNYIIAIDATLFEFPLNTDDPTNGVFLGQLALFAGSVPPEGWVFAEGQLMTVSQNTALFALLGTIYGGDGKSTFALPDLRGTAIMGRGEGPGLSHRDAGERPGAETVTFTVDQLPAHAHTLSPVVGIGQAAEIVEDLIDQGVLNLGQGNALLSKLEAALASLAKGNTSAACGQLKAFINQVNSFVAEGVLTPAEGQVLTEQVSAVMSGLGC